MAEKIRHTDVTGGSVNAKLEEALKNMLRASLSVAYIAGKSMGLNAEQISDAMIKSGLIDKYAEYQADIIHAIIEERTSCTNQEKS